MKRAIKSKNGHRWHIDWGKAGAWQKDTHVAACGLWLIPDGSRALADVPVDERCRHISCALEFARILKEPLP